MGPIYWAIYFSAVAVIALIWVIKGRAIRAALMVNAAPTIPETERVGPVTAYNVGCLKRQYMEREDWTAWDFEERLDEFVRQSSRPFALPVDDVTLVLASAAVLGQSSAGVIPRGMSAQEYAEQLRRAGFTGTPIFEVGREEPVDFIAEATRCKCGALDSPNHRVMCWQADRAPVGLHLPGEPDEAY